MTCIARHYLALASIVVLLSAVTGCGDGDPFERVIVTGSITYDGQPVKEGEIRFLPIGETKVPPNGANIIDGQYRVQSRGGVPVGKYKVMIQAFRYPVDQALSHADTNDADAPRARVQYIPAKYNDKTDLTVEIDAKESEITKNWELDR